LLKELEDKVPDNFLEPPKGRSTSWHKQRVGEPVLKLVEEARNHQQSRRAVKRDS